jgi:hypothetical protein
VGPFEKKEDASAKRVRSGRWRRFYPAALLENAARL